MSTKIAPPATGEKISIRDGKLVVPDNPIIPFIEGDGTGPDIWRASVRVLDAAVAKAYGGRQRRRVQAVRSTPVDPDDRAEGVRNVVVMAQGDVRSATGHTLAYAPRAGLQPSPKIVAKNRPVSYCNPPRLRLLSQQHRCTPQPT